MGQKAELEKIVEIHRADLFPFKDDRWRHVAASWGHVLLDDHRRKVGNKKDKPGEFEDAMALSFEVLALKQPINVVSLKQFGDANDPSCACYQSIVRLRQVIEHVYDLREMEERMHVHIHRQPTQPIVERLGLRTKWTDTSGGAPVDILQPIRPFWMKVGLHAQLGQTLCWRSGSEQWQLGDELDEESPGERKSRAEHRGYFEPMEPAENWRARVGRALLDWPSKFHEPLSEVAQEWRRSEGKDEKVLLSHREAVEAVEAIEPQMVLEPMLSRYWRRWAEPGKMSDSWTQEEVHPGLVGKSSQPDFRIRKDSVGPEGKRLFDAGELTDDNRWYTLDEIPAKNKS
jgi:hypothetical protein